ncbi:Pyrroline-5-carboxylate reductase [Hyphodiscus hymeniophilus]|uniref:Pyrroline-5-carboxylate reductase n=1 Tax=Hyphodiscus hymeniophilus TaxID=353542 RepID=A0A9P7AW23_9HELO|nr:Pyrroline-5-carboxylate reductase [Hyphodiscus hymeniophilus]
MPKEFHYHYKIDNSTFLRGVPMASLHRSAQGVPTAPHTLAILGCGALGTAILLGVLASIRAHGDSLDENETVSPANAVATQKSPPSSSPTPNNFIACVRTAVSAARITKALGTPPCNVTIHHGHDSAPSLLDADIIILGCQPIDLHSCLGNDTIKAALHGKLVISLLAGVTISDIESVLGWQDGKSYVPTTVIRAMPNTASVVRQSMTVIEAPGGTSARTLRMVDWLFSSIGIVQHIPASKFDTCTALCASTPAFFALFLEGLIDGAVALGLTRSEAQIMAAQAMKGSAELVLAGDHPTKVKEEITTPGGSTIRGVLKLEQGNLRAVVAGALIECKTAAEGLGARNREK